MPSAAAHTSAREPSMLNGLSEPPGEILPPTEPMNPKPTSVTTSATPPAANGKRERGPHHQPGLARAADEAAGQEEHREAAERLEQAHQLVLQVSGHPGKAEARRDRKGEDRVVERSPPPLEPVGEQLPHQPDCEQQ